MIVITQEQQQRIKQNQTVEPFNLHLFSQKPQRNCGIILKIILILSGAVDNINIKQEPSSNIDKSQVSDKNLQQPGSISNAISSTFAEILLNSYTNYRKQITMPRNAGKEKGFILRY